MSSQEILAESAVRLSGLRPCQTIALLSQRKKGSSAKEYSVQSEIGNAIAASLEERNLKGLSVSDVA